MCHESSKRHTTLLSGLDARGAVVVVVVVVQLGIRIRRAACVCVCSAVVYNTAACSVQLF